MLRFALKTFRRTLFAIFLILSLALNVALVVSAGVFELASSAVESLTGKRYLAARSADEFSDVSNKLDAERRINRELRSDLASANADLVVERQLRRELRSELIETTAELTAVAAARRRLQRSVVDVSDRVENRMARAATRETAVMAGESVPFWGAAVIVSATTLELFDLCQTAVDMNEIRALFDPNLAVPEDQLTICGLEVPSRQELTDAAVAAPGKAWNSARDALPTLEDVKTFEWPDFNWGGYAQDLRDGTGEIVDDMADGAEIKWEQLKNWWGDSETSEAVSDDP